MSGQKRLFDSEVHRSAQEFDDRFAAGDGVGVPRHLGIYWRSSAAPTAGRLPRQHSRRAELRQRTFVVIDTETTGFKESRIIEVAAITVRFEEAGGTVVRVGASTQWVTLVKPPVPIEALATKKSHMLTAADVVDAPTFPEISDQLLESLHAGTPVFHNGSYDIRALKSEFALMGKELTIGEHVDTYRLAQKLGLPGKLEELSTYLDTSPSTHDAYFDAFATVNVLDAMLTRGLVSLDDLPAPPRKLEAQEVPIA